MKAILGQKFIFKNCVKSKIRPIEKMSFQFINLGRCVKYDIVKIVPQNPSFGQISDFSSSV